MAALGRLYTVKTNFVTPGDDFTCEFQSLGALAEEPFDKAGLIVSGEGMPLMSWFLAEQAVSTFSICLPSWFHLIKKASNHGFYSLFSTRTPMARAPKSAAVPGLRNWRKKRLHDFRGDDGFQRLRGVGTNGPEPDKIGHAVTSESIPCTGHSDIELDAVHVRTDVEVHVETIADRL